MKKQPIFLLVLTLLAFVQLVSADLNDSIAIIGGGFSGLSAAYHLVEKGYTNLHIYEQQTRLGGYATTVRYENVSHDMSTYAMTATYWRFLRAMRGLGADFCNFTADVVDVSSTPPRVVSSDVYVAEQLVRQGVSPSNIRAAIGAQVAKYTSLYNQLFKPTYVDAQLRTERLFPRKPANRTVLAMLAMPMLQFIERNGLELLTSTFVRIADSNAYGPIATTPALYYLTWTPPSLFLSAGAVAPCGEHGSAQALVDLLANHVTARGASFYLGNNVTRVERRNGQAVVVEGATGAQHRFDHVIVTARLARPGTRGSLVHPSLFNERRASRLLEELQIFTALMEAPRADALAPSSILMVDAAALDDPRRDTSFWSVLNAERRDPASAPALSRLPNVTRLGATYFYRERALGIRVSAPVSQQIGAVRNNLRKWDNATWNPVRARLFDGYFQRWRPWAVRNAVPWAISDIQGRGHVFYVNAAACGFESAGHLFDCAKHIVDEHF